MVSMYASVNGLFRMDFTSSQYEQKSVEFTTQNSNNPPQIVFGIPYMGPEMVDASLDEIVLVEK
ncbi:hypothetical protein MN033_09570 [Bacillus nitratireducens]|uniref:hypothetical protein n=1 Tax=Bacillus nitratireducens TaxID=2026193 RepID=UPI001F5A18E6|nr:hypothetical protein [Bacillus nitratireducens]UNP78399.1 hypothetical protein MN033_09570 [Bacillus nitratireducens]